jgi:dienelactone hydrolase
MVRAWSDLARRTGIVLVAPDASDRAEWSVPNDGPESLVRIVEQVTERTSRVDPRRIYLFGHSAGAVFTLYMAALEGDYFAAAVAHGGALGGEGSLEGGAVSRRAPVLLLVGTDDWYATPAKVEATRQQFAAIGQPLLLEWLSGRGHEYLGVSDEVNERAWRFLQAQRLTADPVYHPFNFAERPGR